MIIMLLLGIIVVVDAIIFIKIFRAFRLLQFEASDDKTADNDLPTVTVCIAARNETHAMTQCLERVVTSDYPKLEVIVLDDGSRDDTSVLIKSFAQSGVRFVEGSHLPDGWLGKNYAQLSLAKQASGDIVFFMDVDTLIESHTISRLVSYMAGHSAKMVSVIPMRDDRWHASLLFATMRHFWTVVRFRPGNPRAVANAWLIHRDTLLERFETDLSLASSMQVETTIAGFLAQTKQFRLVTSNGTLGLRYEKRWSSQVETSIRLLFPQRDSSIFKMLFVALMLLLAFLPYTLIFLTPWAWLPVMLQLFIGYYYLSHMWARYRIIGALLAPYTIAQEFVLLVISTYRYKFGTITWKGRSVTSR